MKKLAVIAIFSMLVLLNMPVEAKEEKVYVEVIQNGISSYIEMNERQAEKLKNLLIKFGENMENEKAKQIASMLSKFGVDLLQDENKTFACSLMAYGDGIIIFTPGVILAYLAKNGIVLPFIVYVIILYATHIIPARPFLPASYVMIRNGVISATGIGGSLRLEANGDEQVVTALGFSGITISIPIEEGFVFMLGFAAYVEEGAIFMEDLAYAH